MRWVFARALSMETPWISTQTCGSTMELGLSVFILGSCWAEITYGRNKTAHKYSKRDLSQYLQSTWDPEQYFQARQAKREEELLLTRMVSCVGICPGPPPVFSGSKLDFGWHRKSGLSTYPQRPLGRKRPWFRSICSPGVWKFRATGEQREWSV